MVWNTSRRHRCGRRCAVPITTTTGRCRTATALSVLAFALLLANGPQLVAATTATTASTAAAIVAKDFSSAAIGYFDSIRVPSALIAGSALASMFSLAERTKDHKAATRTRLESVMLIAYHILSIASLLLSLNVVVTATASSNTIMFGNHDPIATSAFALLKREYEFEFQLSRWSFFMGLFSFVGAVAVRALVDFDLLHAQRTISALLVLSAFGTLFFHLLAFVNARLFCYADISEMTKAVFSMWLKRSMEGRSTAELASMGCFFASIVATCAMVARSGAFSAKTSMNKDIGL
jgi:hypothetical protein